MANIYPLRMEVHQSLQDISEKDWSQLCPPYFPFLQRRFLLALETSACLGEVQGWIPHYLCAYRGEAIVGACPLFLKTNSYGEYIFDWAWAEAYQRHSLIYYPKLVAAVPFTPATGHKILLAAQDDPSETTQYLLVQAKELLKATQSSSLHFLFIHPQEIEIFQKAGFMIRKTFQYHWTNNGYLNFQQFLAQMKGRKAKQIRKERQAVVDSEIDVAILSGQQLPADAAQRFYQIYLTTTDKKNAIAYLNEEFFREIFLEMSEVIVLCVAKRSGEWVAASLSFRSSTHLYGRYWGALEDFSFLHFELCYYRLIEFAIEQNLQVFEAGAQGEHKIQRGFLPEATFSAHHIESPPFREAIGRFVQAETLAVEDQMLQLAEHSPFRQI